MSGLTGQVWIGLSLAGLVILTIGFAALSFSWVGFASSTAEISGAQEIEVTVIETGVTEQGTGTNSGYIPQVRYKYEINGETYESENVYPGIGDRKFASRDEAKAVASSYDNGTTARGYVDPENPEQAFLEKPSVARQIFDQIGYAVGTLIGLVLSVFGGWGTITGAARFDR
ncbi:DUF3592 domain-containing protein (plasmid) [Halorientalis pallida]|uniref:DUF3592 domain-containing protein n=1 Tax=Halorientalis pallida TaxID=2479928 RepID=UPI003C6F202E